MDEIFARRDLIEPALLRVLSTRSNRAGFLQLGSHVCAIFATGLALYATLGTSRLPSFIKPVRKRLRRGVARAAFGRSAASADPASRHAWSG